MRAIVQEKYGSTDQLHLRDLPAPTPDWYESPIATYALGGGAPFRTGNT